ncbi:MAG: hypothetical protein ACREMA_20350, partial [Longimicrobiales bacterium]
MSRTSVSNLAGSRRAHPLAGVAVCLLLGLAALWPPTPASAQGSNGVVRGIVVEANTRRPLPGVQVFIKGT